MKKIGFILFLVSASMQWGGAAHPADDLFKQAQVAKTAGKLDDSLHLYEEAISAHPEFANRWFDAQMSIATIIAKKGDFAGAAKAAHLCLDGAPSLLSFDQAVALTANILSAQDGKIDRANQFINFQLTGPTGGQVNPMDAVGYPSQPERETAFAAMRQQAGDDAAASRLRAMTYLFTGKPKDALAQFAEAFRRTASGKDITSPAGVDLVCIGLRAIQGNRLGLDRALQFVSFGPNGPDGKSGTADDLADPFAPLLSAIPAAGEGGSAGLDAQSLATLRQIRDAAQLYAGDARMSPDIRGASLSALQRATSALDGWGAPGQKDWYLRRAMGLDDAAPDDHTTGLLYGAEFASRGRNNHFGEIRAMWAEMDTICAAKGITPPKAAETIRPQFDKMCASLEDFPFPKTTPVLLKSPATFR